MFIKSEYQDLPGGPVVGTLPSNEGGVGSIPGQGAGILRASWIKKPEHEAEVALWQIQ